VGASPQGGAPLIARDTLATSDFDCAFAEEGVLEQARRTAAYFNEASGR